MNYPLLIQQAEESLQEQLKEVERRVAKLDKEGNHELADVLTKRAEKHLSVLSDLIMYYKMRPQGEEYFPEPKFPEKKEIEDMSIRSIVRDDKKEAARAESIRRTQLAWPHLYDSQEYFYKEQQPTTMLKVNNLETKTICQ